MQSREFLALADQLQAFQVIMQGSLKKETEEAKTALAALGSAKDIGQSRTTLEKDKQDFEGVRTRVQADLDMYKQDLVDEAKVLARQEKELAAEQSELGVLVQTSKEAVAVNEKLVADLEKRASAAESKLSKTLASIDISYQALADREALCLSREADVEKKLSIIKSLG